MVIIICNILWLKPSGIASLESHCTRATSGIFISDQICVTVNVKLILDIYFFLKIAELVGMSGIFTLAIMGLFLNSTSFKPGVEALLLE